MDDPGVDRPAVPAAPYESPSSRRRLWLLLLAVTVGAAAWWWVPRGDGSLARVRANGGLRIGYAVEAPYAMVGATGDVTGESAETARLVAEQMGIGRLDWVQADVRDLLTGLRERRFDMVAAKLFVTPERARLVRFSAPTLRVQPGWLTRRDARAPLPPYAALPGHPALRIAVVQGSAEEVRLRGLGLTDERLRSVPSAAAGVALVLDGRVDGLALSLPSVRRLAASAPERLAAAAALDPDHPANAPNDIAFAFHPADADLQAAWNQAQAAVIGTPRHLALIGSFGFAADDLPNRQPGPPGPSPSTAEAPR